MAKNVSVLVVSTEESNKDVVKNLQNLEAITTDVVSCELEKAWDNIVEIKPHVLVCVALENYVLYLELIEKVKEYYKNIDVFLASDCDNAEYILAAFRSGVKDFLKMPCDYPRLSKSLENIYNNINNIQRPRLDHKVISVFSNKGGVGVTTIATNLATALSEQEGASVLLCDFVLQQGDLSIFLDAPVRHTIADVIANMNRIDKDYLENSLVRTKQGLFLLHSSEDRDDGSLINPNQVAEFIQIVKNYFDYVIIDMDHNYSDNNLAIFDNSDIIMLLLTLDLPCIRSCGKTLEVFQKLRYERDKVKLVINRVDAKNQLDIDVVAEQLQYPIFAQLANDYATVVSAVNSGKPVSEVSLSSTITSSVHELRDKVLQFTNRTFTADAKKKKGFLDGMLKKIHLL